MKDKILELGLPEREVDELLRVSTNIQADYNKLIQKYPIQYLIGNVNFCGNKILVNKNVLIPRHETEFLVEKTIGYCENKFSSKIDVLDIGTGSGCIAISMYKRFPCNVTATDVSEFALNTAFENSKINGCDIKFIKTDLYLDVKDKYDVIISNPPYISKNEEVEESVKLYEPHIALYADNNGLYYYEKILKGIKRILKPDFIIAFEIGYTQAESIKKIVNKYLSNVNIIVEQDLSGKDRYIFIISE